jgi:hypothetical protein
MRCKLIIARAWSSEAGAVFKGSVLLGAKLRGHNAIAGGGAVGKTKRERKRERTRWRADDRRQRRPDCVGGRGAGWMLSCCLRVDSCIFNMNSETLVLDKASQASSSAVSARPCLAAKHPTAPLPQHTRALRQGASHLLKAGERAPNCRQGQHIRGTKLLT